MDKLTKNMKILHLSLKKLPFEVMETGEKRHEYRVPSDWILSRLKDKKGNRKEYDAVKFTNGYGKDKPYFIAEFRDWWYKCAKKNDIMKYSNGFEIKIEEGDILIVIELGKILERGNIKPNG